MDNLHNGSKYDGAAGLPESEGGPPPAVAPDDLFGSSTGPRGAGGRRFIENDQKAQIEAVHLGLLSTTPIPANVAPNGEKFSARPTPYFGHMTGGEPVAHRTTSPSLDR